MVLRTWERELVEMLRSYEIFGRFPSEVTAGFCSQMNYRVLTDFLQFFLPQTSIRLLFWGDPPAHGTIKPS